VNAVNEIIEDIKNFFYLQKELYGSFRPLSIPLNENLPDFQEDVAAADENHKSDVAHRSSNELEGFYHQIKDCKKCPLGESRTHFVFGVGNPHADVMFIGEAPGYDEDQEGKPFVGRAGQLLDLMMHSIGLKREDVFIANVLKCRPPNNRDPLPDEIEKCEPYLLRQIELIAPRLIITLGRFAASSLLRTTVALGKLREDIHNYNGVPLIVTYHPAALLRSPHLKSQAWLDLKKINTFLENK
jgi:DNA polymerase